MKHNFSTHLIAKQQLYHRNTTIATLTEPLEPNEATY